MGRERQQQKNSETRQAILDTAIEIGLDEGFEELSIRKITDKLGYSAAMIYHYFKDKQEILDTIHSQASMYLMDTVKKYIKPERGFVKNFKIVFDLLYEISVYHPDTFKLILLNKYSQNSENIKPWIEMIKQSVDYGIEKGEIRKIDSNIISYMLLDTFIVNQMMMSGMPDIDDKRIEEIFQAELDIILNGIINK